MAKVNTSFIKNLTDSYIETLSSEQVADVITFAVSKWGLGIELMPVQKMILKVYYGLPLDETEKVVEVNNDVNDKLLYHFTEVEFMKWLIDNGRTNLKAYVPGKCFRELILCIGRRGSKSTLASIIANYEIYKLVKSCNPQELYGHPLGQELSITSVATNDEQAGTLFSMIQSRALNCGYLKDRIVHLTQNYYDIQTDNDIKVYGDKKNPTIKLVCGGCSSNSLRGGNNILIMFDEAAFFLDNNGRFSGTEVYKALTPSIASFKKKGTAKEEKGDGKIVTMSSPFTRSGIFYELVQTALDPSVEDVLYFKMYSSMLNPKIDSAFLKSEKIRDRAAFICEYGGEFSDTISSWIDDEERFDACVDKSVTCNAKGGKPYTQYFYGVDLGIKNDGTGISIVHREDNQIVLDYSDVFFSKSSDVWDMKEYGLYRNCTEMKEYDNIPIQKIVEKLQYLNEWFPIKGGWFDQYNGYGLHQLCCEQGLKMFEMIPVTESLNMEIYQIAKMLYQDGLLRLFDHPVLISEMKNLQVERRSGANTNRSEGGMSGKFKVRAMQKFGSHDDISDSFIRAVYSCYKNNEGKAGKISMSFQKGSVAGFGTLGAMASSYNAYQLRKGVNANTSRINVASKFGRRLLRGRI